MRPVKHPVEQREDKTNTALAVAQEIQRQYQNKDPYLLNYIYLDRQSYQHLAAMHHIYFKQNKQGVTIMFGLEIIIVVDKKYHIHVA